MVAVGLFTVSCASLSQSRMMALKTSGGVTESHGRPCFASLSDPSEDPTHRRTGERDTISNLMA